MEGIHQLNLLRLNLAKRLQTISKFDQSKKKLIILNKNFSFQCLKCLIPVKAIARLASSAAFITSSSRIEPPGWIIAVAPA